MGCLEIHCIFFKFSVPNAYTNFSTPAFKVCHKQTVQHGNSQFFVLFAFHFDVVFSLIIVVITRLKGISVSGRPSSDVGGHLHKLLEVLQVLCLTFARLEFYAI